MRDSFALLSTYLNLSDLHALVLSARTVEADVYAADAAAPAGWQRHHDPPPPVLAQREPLDITIVE
jgi:hypothetical protein